MKKTTKKLLSNWFYFSSIVLCFLCSQLVAQESQLTNFCDGNPEYTCYELVLPFNLHKYSKLNKKGPMGVKMKNLPSGLWEIKLEAEFADKTALSFRFNWIIDFCTHSFNGHLYFYGGELNYGNFNTSDFDYQMYPLLDDSDNVKNSYNHFDRGFGSQMNPFCATKTTTRSNNYKLMRDNAWNRFWSETKLAGLENKPSNYIFDMRIRLSLNAQVTLDDIESIYLPGIGEIDFDVFLVNYVKGADLNVDRLKNKTYEYQYANPEGGYYKFGISKLKGNQQYNILLPTHMPINNSGEEYNITKLKPHDDYANRPFLEFLATDENLIKTAFNLNNSDGHQIEFLDSNYCEFTRYDRAGPGSGTAETHNLHRFAVKLPANIAPDKHFKYKVTDQGPFFITNQFIKYGRFFTANSLSDNALAFINRSAHQDEILTFAQGGYWLKPGIAKNHPLAWYESVDEDFPFIEVQLAHLADGTIVASHEISPHSITWPDAIKNDPNYNDCVNYMPLSRFYMDTWSYTPDEVCSYIPPLGEAELNDLWGDPTGHQIETISSLIAFLKTDTNAFVSLSGENDIRQIYRILLENDVENKIFFKHAVSNENPRRFDVQDLFAKYGNIMQQICYTPIIPDWLTTPTQVLDEFLAKHNEQEGWTIPGFELVIKTPIEVAEYYTEGSYAANPGIPNHPNSINGNTSWITKEMIQERIDIMNTHKGNKWVGIDTPFHADFKRLCDPIADPLEYKCFNYDLRADPIFTFHRHNYGYSITPRPDIARDYILDE